MQWLETCVHALDKVVVNGFVYLFVEKSHFHCGVELSCLGTEPIGLYTTFVQAGKCVDFVDVALVVGLECLTANFLVLVIQAHGVSSVAKCYFLAIHHDGAKFDVATVQTVENFLELTGKSTNASHQRFFRCGQDVRFAIQDVLQLDVVVGKCWISNAILEVLVGLCGKFGGYKCCCGGKLCEHAVATHKSALTFGVLSVFVVTHKCVAIKLAKMKVVLVALFHKLEQSCFVAKFALVCGKVLVLCAHFYKARFPIGRGSKNVGEVPLVFFGDLVAVCVRHGYPPRFDKLRKLCELRLLNNQSKLA